MLRNCIFILFLLICLVCSAQPAPTELAQRIERRLRTAENVPATVNIILSSPHASTSPNYDGVTVTFEDEGKEQEYEYLLSKDRKTLIRLTKIDLTKDPYAEAMKKIKAKDLPVRGNPHGAVVAVSYGDFECPYSAEVYQTLFPELLKEYGDRVAFIFKDFPLSEVHPWATHAGVNANCLAAQSSDAYWDFADYIHNNQRIVNSAKDLSDQFAALDHITMTEAGKFKLNQTKLRSCIKAQNDKAIRVSIKEGKSLGVSGTPTMFVNGQRIDGAQPASAFRAAFDDALRQAEVLAPSTSLARSENATTPVQAKVRTR
jgi:protein-disulfide isomerase